MPETFISDAQVARRFGVHRSTPWRWVKADASFPKPIVLSPGCTRWRLSDIVAWEATRESLR